MCLHCTIIFKRMSSQKFGSLVWMRFELIFFFKVQSFIFIYSNSTLIICLHNELNYFWSSYVTMIWRKMTFTHIMMNNSSSGFTIFFKCTLIAQLLHFLLTYYLPTHDLLVHILLLILFSIILFLSLFNKNWYLFNIAFEFYSYN